jgi:hypothetical protein
MQTAKHYIAKPVYPEPTHDNGWQCADVMIEPKWVSGDFIPQQLADVLVEENFAGLTESDESDVFPCLSFILQQMTWTMSNANGQTVLKIGETVLTSRPLNHQSTSIKHRRIHHHFHRFLCSTGETFDASKNIASMQKLSERTYEKS